MADNILHSPGIQITETDQSFVPARPLIAGAAIVGPTVKGPAFSPVVCTSYGDFQRKFGTTFMMNRYVEGFEEKAEAAREEYEDSASVIRSASAAELNTELNDRYVCVTDGEIDPETNQPRIMMMSYGEALEAYESGSIDPFYICVKEDQWH